MADKSIQKLKPGTTPPAVPFVLVFGTASLGFGFAFDYLNVETLLRNVLFKGSEENAIAVVLLAVVLAGLLNTYLSGLVVGARAAHGVALPFMYPCAAEKHGAAKDPAAYMAVVRNHENYMEFLPLVLAYLAFNVAVVRNAATMAVLSMLFIVARVMYARGYTSGDVTARMRGFLLSVWLYYAFSGPLYWYFVRTVLLS